MRTRAIFDRLKAVLRVATDSEVAALIGRKQANVSYWINSNSPDFNHLFDLFENKVNLHWLITGKGTPELPKDNPDGNSYVQMPDKFTVTPSAHGDCSEIQRERDALSVEVRIYKEQLLDLRDRYERLLLSLSPGNVPTDKPKSVVQK